MEWVDYCMGGGVCYICDFFVCMGMRWWSLEWEVFYFVGLRLDEWIDGILNNGV